MHFHDEVAAWREYVAWSAARIARENCWCDGCDGYGYQGFEEETYLPYICYRCCGTGVDTEKDPC